MASLFVFAHQDDDYGVFHCVAEDARKDSVHCIYLTDGGIARERRNRESLDVLARLGVTAENVHFLGQDHNFEDGRLYLQLESAVRVLSAFLEQHNDISRIFVPAWEGGHIDHDAAHAAVLLAVRNVGLAVPVLQFSLYNSWRCPRPFYRVMRPVADAPMQKIHIPLASAYRYVTLPWHYPSQWKIWIGLYPFILYAYLVRRTILIQEAAFERLLQRPHDGPLYYERKPENTYAALHACIGEVLRSLPLPPAAIAGT